MANEFDESKSGKESFPWYKRDARAFYEGTRSLTLEARAVYSDIIDLMFIHNGPLRDDAKWMSHATFVSVRKWRAIRGELLKAGKIEIVGDAITNSRAVLELEKRASQRRVNRENSVKHSREIDENSENDNEINETAEQIDKQFDPVREELEKKRRKKERKIEKKNDRSILSIEDLVEEIWLATSGRMIDDHDDPSALVKAWRRDGATDEDITETIRAVAANKREESIDHFGYFNQAVRDGMADRKAGQPNRHVPPREETQAEYLARRIAEDRAQDLAEAETHGTA